MGEDPESALVKSLRALADGGEADGSKWNITRGGLRVRVFYSGGSGSYLRLSVPYDMLPTAAVESVGARGYRDNAAPMRPIRAKRPLSIVLRPETATDRDDKEAGISREVQTGDAVFDPKVYVDTPAEDEVVAPLLAPAAVREAVLELFRLGFTKVEVDNGDGDVSVTVTYFREGSHVQDRAERALAAFGKLARALPRVEKGGVREPQGAGCGLMMLYALAILALFGGVPLYFSLSPAGCVIASSDGEGSNLDCGRMGCCEPGAQGLLLGLVLAPVAWMVASRLARRWMGGRSNSGGRIRTFSFFAALWTVEATIGLLMLFYWR